MHPDLYTPSSNEPRTTTTSSSTHHVQRDADENTLRLWKCTPTDTQSPLFPYHRCCNPSRLLSHSLRLGSVQSGLHSALPIPDERPFTIQLAVINYHHRHYYHNSCTSKAPSKPTHQGELSHGIKILFLMFSRTKTASTTTTKITVLTLALILSVICRLEHVTPQRLKRTFCTWEERDMKV